MQCQQESAFKALGGPAVLPTYKLQFIALHACMCVCVCVCVCVLDTCELISNDYADYGLADYGLHGFEKLIKNKAFFLLEHSAQCIYTGHMSIRCVCRPTGSKPSSSQA